MQSTNVASLGDAHTQHAPVRSCCTFGPWTRRWQRQIGPECDHPGDKCRVTLTARTTVESSNVSGVLPHEHGGRGGRSDKVRREGERQRQFAMANSACHTDPHGEGEGLTHPFAGLKSANNVSGSNVIRCTLLQSHLAPVSKLCLAAHLTHGKAIDGEHVRCVSHDGEEGGRTVSLVSCTERQELNNTEKSSRAPFPYLSLPFFLLRS